MKAKAENLYETHSEGGFLDDVGMCWTTFLVSVLFSLVNKVIHCLIRV